MSTEFDQFQNSFVTRGKNSTQVCRPRNKKRHIGPNDFNEDVLRCRNASAGWQRARIYHKAHQKDSKKSNLDVSVDSLLSTEVIKASSFPHSKPAIEEKPSYDPAQDIELSLSDLSGDEVVDLGFGDYFWEDTVIVAAIEKIAGQKVPKYLLRELGLQPLYEEGGRKLLEWYFEQIKSQEDLRNKIIKLKGKHHA